MLRCCFVDILIEKISLILSGNPFLVYSFNPWDPDKHWVDNCPNVFFQFLPEVCKGITHIIKMIQDIIKILSLYSFETASLWVCNRWVLESGIFGNYDFKG